MIKSIAYNVYFENIKGETITNSLDGIKKYLINKLKQSDVTLGPCKSHDVKVFRSLFQKGQILESIDHAESVIMEPKKLDLIFKPGLFSLYWESLLFNEFLICVKELNTIDYEYLWRMAQVKILGFTLSNVPEYDHLADISNLINSPCKMKLYRKKLTKFLNHFDKLWDITSKLYENLESIQNLEFKCICLDVFDKSLGFDQIIRGLS